MIGVMVARVDVSEAVLIVDVRRHNEFSSGGLGSGFSPRGEGLSETSISVVEVDGKTESRVNCKVVVEDKLDCRFLLRLLMELISLERIVDTLSRFV